MLLAHNTFRNIQFPKLGIGICMSIALLLSGAIMADGTAQARYARTVNWTRVDQALLKAEQAPPPEKGSIRKITLPFEHLRNMTSTHLIRAAEEGIYVAQIQMKGRPQIMVERQIDVNIARALSGYPYVAPGEDGFNAILDLLKGNTTAEPVRIYILKRVVPGLAPIDSFSLYLQDQVQSHQDILRDILGKLTTTTIEESGIKIQAMNTLYQSFYTELITLLHSDTAVQEKEAELKRPVVPMDLKAPTQIQLTRRTQNEYQKLISTLESYYSLVDGVVKDPSNAEPVKDEARALLSRMVKELPITARPSTRTIVPEIEKAPETTLTPNPLLEFDLGLPKL